jgi:tetratricopeptide (TPR) repeat protein
MTDPILAKIQILLQQEKYKDAEKLLKDLLATDPNDELPKFWLSEVYIQTDRLAEAEQVVDQLIGQSPDSPIILYQKSRLLLQREDYNGAEHFAKQALELDPEDADYYTLLARIKFSKRDYQGALDLCDQALQLDSENLSALNLRSTALIKLGRKDESFQTIEGALREDPNNPMTHTNYGWGLLEAGDHKKAKEHFKEALQRQPNNEVAQAGLLESIKATNPVYRLFLKYAFFMGNLAAQNQWIFLVGFVFVTRFLRSIANSNESLRPILIPIVILLSILAFSTWIIEPIGNLFLRFNKYGKLLLGKNEKQNSSMVAICVGLLVIGLVLYFATSNIAMLSFSLVGFGLMPSVGRMFSDHHKLFYILYAIGMIAFGSLAILSAVVTGELINGITFIFIIGFVAFGWISNFFTIK